MKLKKLLAAAVAAALAVTTMAVTSFTASAATPIYSVTLEASGAAGYNIPIDGVDFETVETVEVSFKSTMGSMNGGGGYKCTGVGDDNWVATSMFSCALGEGETEKTITYAIDTSVNKPEEDIQIQFWYMSGAGKIDITSVAFKDENGDAVGAGLTSPFSITVAKRETGSTSVTPVDGIDYTSVAKIEVDVASSTAKGTNGAIGVNKNDEGGWEDASNATADKEEAWTDTWTLTGLDGCAPSSLQVQFYSIDIGQVLSVTAIRFYDSEGNELTAGGETPVVPDTPSTPGDDTPSTPGDDTPGDDTPSGDRTYALVWEGTKVIPAGWSDYLQLSADLFSGAKVGDVLAVTIAPDAGAQISLKSMGEGWPALPGFAAANGGNDYCDTSETTYTLTLTGADITAIASGVIVSGQNYTVTKVELNPDKKPAGGDVVEPGGSDPDPVAPAPSAPSSSSGSVSSSTNPAPVSSTTVVDKILATPDGGSSSVTLGSSTKLDKVAIEALATKGDVTVKFDVAGGAYWEINGENVTDAKAVDLGVKVNGNLIPESKVSEFAGDKTTVQLTLRHNGDFGFTGTLNVPVGSANNGKFANLYYYHGGKFDFIGSSAISGGMTKFAFSHASNYLIVIDDYAYGEDVSSAAGMTETTAAETNAFPYVAVLVVIAAFGTSAIVLKKRLSK